jgi:xylulokinase
MNIVEEKFMNCYLGLDIGTTGVKAAVFTSDGVMAGSGLAEYALETPAPDIVELETEQYWISAKQAIAEAVARARIRSGDIRSLAVTGQAETLIFSDGRGVPVRKAIVWLDNRAREEAAELERKFTREKLFRMSGQTEMLPCWPAAKILWLKRHEPEIFARTAKCLMVEDYIVYKLTGKYATCRGLMPSSLYYDIRTGKYDSAMLRELGLREDQLPELKHPGEFIGECILNDSPLEPGIPVAAAPIDHVCGNLGSGCFRSGMISETTGCTLALCAAFPSLVYDEQKRLSTYLGFAPGSYVLLPWAPTAGMLLKHFRDEFASGMRYKDFDAAAASVKAGSEGLILLPHCAGAVSPDCNPDARGVAWGVTLAHKRGHWARAIMESVAYLLRDNVEALRAMGAQITEIRSLGGASRSRLWLQIKADVLNLPVTVTECQEAASLGAAILGAVGCGDYPDAASAATRMVKTAARVEPGADVKIYRKSFERYRRLNRLLLPTFGGKS